MGQTAAMVLAIFVATLVTLRHGDVLSAPVRGAVDHGKAQAAAEFRRARQQVYDTASERLRAKLDEGRAKGPGSAWWWAMAAGKAGRGLYRAMRGIRPGAEPEKMPAATPWKRIRDAALAGAKKRTSQAARAARERRKAARAQRGGSWRDRARRWTRDRRDSDRAPWDTPTGVCDNCGVTCARFALRPAPLPGVPGLWLLCAACRSPRPETTTPPGPGTDTAPPEALGAPRIPIDPAPATPEGAPVLTGEPPMAADLAIRRPGAPAHGRPGRAVTTAGDGQLTHGTWNRQQDAIASAIEQARACQEGMLGNLRAVDAGRGQIAAITAWSDRVTAYLKFLEDGQAELNRRLGPVVQAVTAAGGPDEIAKPAHYAEV